jgi:hypothetical protein
MGVRKRPNEIPHIIHQTFIGGKEQLLEKAMRAKPHFRKEWWLSCKVSAALR